MQENNFRSLCRQILALLDYYIPEENGRPTCWDPWRQAARAALSAPKRAEGVGELALELGDMAEAAADDSRLGDAHFLSRAAALLAQRHPAPVPVAERLPGEVQP